MTSAPITFKTTHKKPFAQQFCSECKKGNQAHPDVYMRPYYHVPSSREIVGWQCVRWDGRKMLWTCTCEHGLVCQKQEVNPTCHHLQTVQTLIASGVFPKPEVLVEGRYSKADGNDVSVVLSAGKFVVQYGRIVESSEYELFDGDLIATDDPDTDSMSTTEFHNFLEEWAANK